MNRSTGLLRAYTALIRRVSGADSVSLFIPSGGDKENTPILLQEGTPVLPELADNESALAFGEAHPLPADEASERFLKIDSAAAHGWLIAVPRAPLSHPQLDAGASPGRRANDTIPRSQEDQVAAWIGLRFGDGEAAESRSTESYRLLTGMDGKEQWASLLSLGGVLAWYAWQISTILDDPVTGLAGRAEFQASLGHALDIARESERPLSLLFINPDDFTVVNERFGHEAGDRVLREIGERLRATQRGSDSIAKYGGAIFASFLIDTNLTAASVVAEKIWANLAEAAYLDDTARLGISIGLAVFEPGDETIEGHAELIRRADKALNAAKRFGGDHVAAWGPELEAKDIGHLDRMTGVYTGNMAKDYRNMTLLSDTMTVVAGSAGVAQLATKVVERLYSTLRADHVGIFEWKKSDEPVLLKGLTKRAESSGESEAEDGLELNRSRWAHVEDARRQKRALLVSYRDDYSDHKVLSFAVPLMLNDDCLGCLYLDGRAGSMALEDSSDLAFLRAFATQLAVALDRARLSEHEMSRQESEKNRLRSEVNDLRAALYHSKLEHRSPEMEAVLDTVRRVAPTQATVLVIGESGTGKELIARTIHELSPFRKKPLVVVDCGAIPMTLIESELFGHERGAYTGAQERRIGRLLEAEGGTVVLDEIGELPLEVQSKLLRFVQDKQLTPVGSTRVRRVDTRLIAVTNRELAVEAAAGRFREDLYYRLNVVRISVPPLRERPDDILYLAEHFLTWFGKQYQKESITFSDAARHLMLDYPWPGNVRELENRIMQAVILCEGEEVGVAELDLESFPPGQTVEIDVSSLQKARRETLEAVSEVEPRSRQERPAPETRTATEAWEALRLALRQQIQEVAASDGARPLPIGRWLMEDLVLEAYEAADSVSGRGRTLLGIPETTFRRRLRKATAQAESGLLMRMPLWEHVRPLIAALVRTPEVNDTDVLAMARRLLLREVSAQIDDTAFGAALMGVTVRTYRRWITEESRSDTASQNGEARLAV